jgi:hypothetical protein
MKPTIKPGCLCLVKNLNARGPFECPPNAGDIVTAVRYLGTKQGTTPQGFQYITVDAWEVTNQEIEDYLKHNNKTLVGVRATSLVPISDPDLRMELVKEELTTRRVVVIPTEQA